MVLGRAYQPPQRRPMDLARQHLETMWQENTTRETSQAVERRPGQILERHDMAEDSTRQGHLETTCWGLHSTTGHNGCIMMMEMMTSLPDVMGNNKNNSQLIQLLCTFNICEKPVCCQDSIVRHDEAEIMLSSYMLYDIKEGTHRVRIFYVKTTFVFLFWRDDPGRLMWNEMSSSKTGMVPSSVISLLWYHSTRCSKAFSQATFCEIGTPHHNDAT